MSELSHKSNRRPAIRFKGFTDPWEQRKFFDNIKRTIDFRGRTPKKLGMDWSKSGYPALSALNVKKGYIDPSADVHYGNKELYEKWMTGKELYRGQVLFTTEAPMGNVAQIPDDSKYILSQRTIAFDVNFDKITNDFLAVLLSSPKSFNELSSLSSGGTAKGVSQKSLSSFSVILPTGLEEQQRIATFFKQLDHLIALHQRKVEVLQNLKKALLQRMFASKDNPIPDIRFAGFTDPWEQRKLGEVATTYIGLVTTMTENYTDQGTLLIRNSDIKEGKFNLNNPIYLNEEFAEKNKTRRMKVGDVVTVHTGDIGTSAVITKALDGSIGFATITTRPSKNLNSNFLSWYFNSDIHKRYARRMSTGDGRSNYNMKDFNKNIIAMPKLKEQQKGGLLFNCLDNLITLHQREP